MAANEHDYVAVRAFKADGVSYSMGDPVDFSSVRNAGTLEAVGCIVPTNTPHVAHAQDDNADTADTSTASSQSDTEPDASNKARELADELGVSLAEIPGSGSGGKVTVNDVREHAETQTAAGDGG